LVDTEVQVLAFLQMAQDGPKLLYLFDSGLAKEGLVVVHELLENGGF